MMVLTRFFIFIVLILLVPIGLEAGNYGTLKGTVVDQDGNPVVGASVRIQGTRLGGVVRADGRFIVVSIPPGTYEVKVTAVGYKASEVTVRISADDETEIRVVLVEEGKVTEEVTVVAERLVSHKDIGVKRQFENQQLTSIAREGLQAIIGLSAGVFNTGGGWVIRGSRTSESQIRIDGLDVSDKFTGGFGIVGATYYPMVSAFATEEVQVLTGGFSAEYGNVLGGFVNTTLRSGRTDRYDGFVRWRTDVPALFGRQRHDLKLIREGDRYKAIDWGEGRKLQGTNEHTFEFGIGGPIPLIDKATFFFAGNLFYEKYRSASYDIYDPVHINNLGKVDQNNLGRLPNNQSWKKSFQTKLKFPVAKDIDLIAFYNFGLTNLETLDWGWLYAIQPGAIPGLPSYGVPERAAKSPVYNQFAISGYLQIQHRIGSNSFYEFKISNTSNNSDASKRKTFDPPHFFKGFDIWYPQDNYAVALGSLENGKDKIVDQYSPISQIGPSKDGFIKMDLPIVNPLTGYIEGSSSTQHAQNAYGLTGIFDLHGNERTFEFRRSNYWQIDGNYTLAVEGEFSHMFKAGFEVQFYQLRRHMNNLPWDANPFFDVYTDDWGGNLYADNEQVYKKTSKPYKPITGGFYIQDQITYKGLIITPGLRFDFFAPNSDYRTIVENFVPISSDKGFAKASVKTQISPRINVTYPITDRSNISISYGTLFQMSPMQYLYDGFAVEQLRGNAIIGNTNMKPQKSNMYQVTYNNQLTDDFALDISSYYKDNYNQVGLVYVAAVPTPYYLFSVSEYGSARGIEFTLRKRPTNHIQLNLNYNLSFATTTGSSPGSNYLVAVDPFTGEQAFPLAEFPFSADRTHRVNAIIDFIWGPKQGPSIAGIYPLENLIINLTGFFQTGTPYTRLDRGGNAIGEFNAERHPSIWNANMRIVKGFFLRDWFGESAKNARLEFFVDVNNVFNLTMAVAHFARSGDPIDDGVNFYRPETDFSAIVYYREADYARAESFSTEQYTIYGDRFYSVNSDFDRNGIVTRTEKFQAFTKYLEDARRFRGNFFAPRTVYAGIMFRF
ncbi:MAG: carboxypeptidase regulatory-like domain-containing protein [Ignavibacteria bacterium]|nr:carboxypeptidase regulatory-like domain-containing protein [Ignavibacteria bacterium]